MNINYLITTVMYICTNKRCWSTKSLLKRTCCIVSSEFVHETRLRTNTVGHFVESTVWRAVLTTIWRRIRKIMQIKAQFCVDHCDLLLKHLYTPSFQNKRFQTCFIDQLARSKTTFNASAEGLWDTCGLVSIGEVITNLHKFTYTNDSGGLRSI